MSHWYNRVTQQPNYTVIGKNGKERAVSLADARKDKDLVPGTTDIISEANRPQLTTWISEQLLNTALDNPFNSAAESKEDYIKRISALNKEKSKLVMDKGSDIHDLIEQYFLGEALSLEDSKWGMAVVQVLNTECGQQDWIAEKSFATDKYGGKVDLHCTFYIVDFKTTEKPLDKVDVYDSHFMQLAAYRQGLGLASAQCGIVYVNSLSAEAKLIWVSEKDMMKGYAMFRSLLNFWFARTGL